MISPSTKSMRNVLRMRFLLLGTIPLLLLALMFYLVSRRAQLEVSNVGPTPLHKVVLEVTGKSYSLGDIAPGTSKTIPIAPLGNSSLTIRHLVPLAFDNTKEAERSLWIPCHLEPISHGKMVVQINAGRVANILYGIVPGP